MYGYDYAYEPATEGLAEIGNWVTAKIQAAKDMIKKAIDAVKAKLKMMSGKAENVKSNSSEATQLVSTIAKNTTEILDKTIEQIDLLYEAFDIIAEKTDIDISESRALGSDKDSIAAARKASRTAAAKKAMDLVNSGYRGTMNLAYGANNGNYDTTITGSGWTTKKGGMKSGISKNATSEQLQQWEAKKREIGQSMAKQAEAAELVKADLKKLTSYGPLSRTATEAGYNGLRNIFAGNEEVMNKWKRVKTATEWSVGEIHKILSKIMNLYDVGIKATDAFGKRLASGNYRKDDGTRYDKKDLKAGNARWKSSTALDKEGREKKSKWDNSASSIDTTTESASYVLERIYQAAYEDALQDIADAEYYEQVFESVPDYMPGFDEYLEDAEYYPDEY